MNKEKVIKYKWPLLFACLIMAAAESGYTVYLGNYASWTEYNLSVVGGWYGHKWGLMIWGWLTAFVFVSFMSLVLIVNKYRGKASWILEAAAGVVLSVAVIIPYQPRPNEGSVISNIHITLSMIGPLCLVAAMIAFTVSSIKRGNRAFIFTGLVLLLMMACAAWIFIIYGIITTVLEVYTVSAMTLLLTLMFLASYAGKKESV